MSSARIQWERSKGVAHCRHCGKRIEKKAPRLAACGWGHSEGYYHPECAISTFLHEFREEAVSIIRMCLNKEEGEVR